MRVGYLIDTNQGGYDPPMPTPKQAHDTMDAMITEGILAEKAGFHSLQIPERHGRTECYFPGPLQLLTILAYETQRVGLGSFSQVATLYHPMMSAEHFSVIDNVSRGRLSTTVSRGYHPGYWMQYGIPQEKLLGRFKEFLAVWEDAVKGERFDFEGDHYRVEDGLLAPQPYQQGGWPIWGGSNAGPTAVRRCAEYASCWCCDSLPISPKTFMELSEAYQERARELDKQPFVLLMRDAWVADSFEDASQQFGTSFVDEMLFYFRRGVIKNYPEFASEADITPERAASQLVMGSPQQCIEQLERYREEWGVEYVVVRFRMASGPSLEAAREQIQRFGEEVVAPIHKKYPAPNHPAVPVGCRW
jgi:alkanesulfonate monooxygenase SsuD/methylene tetrahydromethanopterin reductase-like flavin-dependent oxidoreductase (luciferase family)